MQRILMTWILIFWAASIGAAQGASPVVEAKIVMETDVAHRNSTVRAAVIAHVVPGYHINDHKPTLDYLIPTDLKLEPISQVTVKNIVYPKGKPVKMAFSDMALSVYEGTVVVGAVFQVARVVRPGVYPVKAKFVYQACNDHACLPPASVPLALTIKVVRRSVPIKHVNEDVFDRINFE
jgi:hypothetical protein